MSAVALLGALSALPKPVILVADVGIDDAGGLLWAAPATLHQRRNIDAAIAQRAHRR